MPCPDWFIRRWDWVGADYRRTLLQMEQRLAARPVLLELPIGEEYFSGVIDLLDQERRCSLIWANLGMHALGSRARHWTPGGFMEKESWRHGPGNILAALWDGSADVPAGVGDSGSQLGPREAFELIVKRHMKDAYLDRSRSGRNREDALELSQEAFSRACTIHYDTLHSKGKFFPWFYQILRNLCFSDSAEKAGPAGQLVVTTRSSGAPEPEGCDRFEPDGIADATRPRTASGRP